MKTWRASTKARQETLRRAALSTIDDGGGKPVRLPPHRINLANYERRSRDACYYFEPVFALRLAAHRAFMASDNFFLPAGVRPPFFLGALVREVLPALRRAQFALAAAESLARVAADMPLLPLARAGEGGVLPPKSEANRRSSV